MIPATAPTATTAAPHRYPAALNASATGGKQISLADMIRNLKTRLFAAGQLSVVEFFETLGSKRELVTAFVAVLEIVRTEGVRLVQRNTFGDIMLRAENIG